MSRERKPEFPMGIYNSAGALVFLSISPDEESMWRWMLGWPSKEEVAAKKSEGYVCRTVMVSIL